jgi:hypothetical protein
MLINPISLLPVEKLCLNQKANPKLPMGTKYKQGLRLVIKQFGFAAVLVVAENLNGTYEVLDGTTRTEELERDGVEEVPCAIVSACKEGVADWQKLRTEFKLGHDRMRKVFDETAVLEQLRDLAAQGEDLKRLAVLSGKHNLERLLEEASKRQSQVGAIQKSAAQAMQSLVLYGPEADITAIKELLKGIKGRLSTAEKAHKALAQGAEFLDLTDEQFLAILLSTIKRFTDDA